MEVEAEVALLPEAESFLEVVEDEEDDISDIGMVMSKIFAKPSSAVAEPRRPLGP